MKRNSIDYRRSYDIYTIGTFREGRVRVRASFQPARGDGDDPELSFSVAWRPGRDGVAQDGGWLSGGISLPLWFDRSSSCVLPVLERIADDLPRQALVGRDRTATLDAPRMVAPLANMGPEPMVLDFGDIISDNTSSGPDAAGRVRIKSQSPEFPSTYLEARFELDLASDPVADGNTRGTQGDPIVID